MDFLIVLALTAMCHLIGYSFLSQCSVAVDRTTNMEHLRTILVRLIEQLWISNLFAQYFRQN